VRFLKISSDKLHKRHVQRTLHDFANATLTLLQTQSLEDMTTKDICDSSNYPRATFYNYFYDKYDLVHYCFDLISQKIELDPNSKHTSPELVSLTFTQLYDLLETHRSEVEDILKYNTKTQQLIREFMSYLKNTISIKIENCIHNTNGGLPPELLAQHFSNTTILVIDWTLYHPEISFEQAHQYLNYLLGIK